MDNSSVSNRSLCIKRANAVAVVYCAVYPVVGINICQSFVVILRKFKFCIHVQQFDHIIVECECFIFIYNTRCMDNPAGRYIPRNKWFNAVSCLNRRSYRIVQPNTY